MSRAVNDIPQLEIYDIMIVKTHYKNNFFNQFYDIEDHH